MTDYRALIANCILGGEHITNVDGRHVQNLIRLQLGRFQVEIMQRPEFIEAVDFTTFTFEDSVGETVHTTDLIIRDLPATDFDRAELLARDVAELLSFASSSPVAVLGYDFAEIGPPNEPRRLVGQLEYFRPLFGIPRGKKIRSFLQKAWPAYQCLRKVRKLDVAFDYYVLAEKGRQPLELKLAIVSILLESLKYTFALERKYPVVRKRFHSHGPTAAKPGKRISFKELLREMFQAVDMSPRLEPIVKLRNELIHSGMCGLSPEEQWEMYQANHDLLREYFLRLLGYQGEFCIYSGIKTIR